MPRNLRYSSSVTILFIRGGEVYVVISIEVKGGEGNGIETTVMEVEASIMIVWRINIKEIVITAVGDVEAGIIVMWSIYAKKFVITAYNINTGDSVKCGWNIIKIIVAAK